MLSLLSLFSLLGCELFSAESVGAFTCDKYCDEVVAKTNECAQAAFEEQCAADPDCGDYAESDLAAYASEGRSDWADASSDEMVASCESDLSAAGKTDSECQVETAVLNNLTCDEILQLLGTMQSGA
ncbi:MAG: hypothetical protein EXR71_19520 [Myxococcales bacterium]|nr:hypothetical protein [Myxococcales bacterium]